MNKIALLFTILLLIQVTPQLIDLSTIGGGTSTPNPPIDPPNPPSNPPTDPIPTSQTNSSNVTTTQSNSTQSQPQLIRLRDIQLPGQTLAETLARLSPRISNQSIPKTDPPLTRRLLQTNPIQAKIDSFGPAPYVPDFFTQTRSQVGTTPWGQKCNYDEWKYSSPTNEFLHVDFSYSNIFPSSVIQSKYLKGVLDGTQSQVPVPAGSNLLNPTVPISDQANVNILNPKYDFVNVSRAISGAIGLAAPQNKDYTIYFEMGTSDDLDKFAQKLDLNLALLKKLGLYSQPGSILTKYKKKILFFFTKPIATFNSLMSGTKQKTPLSTFFSNGLTLNIFNSYISSWWGPGNPPTYIDSVTYGSIIIFTVDYNIITKKLYDKIDQQFMNGPAAVQPYLNQILAHPSRSVFSRGPFTSIQLNILKNANWLQSMISVPNSISNMVLQPFIYTVKDFNQVRYKVANQFNFTQVCQSPIPPPQPHKIFIKLQYIINSAPVLITVKTLTGNIVFKLYFYCSTIFDLTPYLNDPKMIVVIRPTVSCTCTGFMRQQVKAGFIVDTTYTHKLLVDCSGYCTQYDAGTYTIDKINGIITP